MQVQTFGMSFRANVPTTSMKSLDQISKWHQHPTCMRCIQWANKNSQAITSEPAQREVAPSPRSAGQLFDFLY